MKKIGFVDYYISEWHANNYPVWMKEICEKEGLDFEIAYAWAEEYVSPVYGENTDEWCKRFQVTRCQTIEELCEKSDVILVLAPSNPEKHLPYARKVLPYGKLTFIDKSFATDSREAREIFALAEKYHTPFFSSSALRFATELSELKDPKSLIITGGGSNITEYSIHLLEMLVKLTGLKAFDRVMQYSGAKDALPCGEHRIFRLEGTDRVASLIFEPSLGYQLTADGKTLPVVSGFFNLFLKDVLMFYQNGASSFDTRETLEIMAVRDACLKACEVPGEWVSIEH